MNKTQAKDLLIVRKRLLKVAKKPVPCKIPGDGIMSVAFKMEYFGQGMREGQCRTAACVLGHAALIPALTAKGLKMQVLSDGIGSVRFRDDRDDDAGAAFFGLTNLESHLLFMSGWSKSAKQKAGDILKLVRKYHPSLAEKEGA